MNKGIDAEWLENLKANNDIVTTISKYVPLVKKGKSYWGCCPFHFEKTPSFAVNEYDGFYHCFGCGASGDVIKFIQNIESCDFMSAIKLLAKNANIEVPVFTVDENIIKQKQKKEILLKILHDSAVYYYKNLNLPQSKIALDYMFKRGLDKQTIKAFGIGYSLGFNEIVSFLQKQNYKLEDMLDSGVVEKSNNKVFDAQTKRLVFPIQNSYGEIVGFSARLLEQSSFAKYKNTAETMCFNKSKCVYGIYQLKKEKQTNGLDEIIVVEGQMDVISLYKAGIKNSVACMGTAMTLYHAKELKKYADKIILCFDGDGAGKKATIRSIEMVVSVGFSVFVVAIKDNLDPDEYIKKYGANAFNEMMGQAKYWVDYLIDNFATNYDLEKNDQKKQFILDSLEIINKLQTESEREIYLNKLRMMTNISTSVLKNDILNISTKQPNEANIKVDTFITTKKLENNYIKAVKFILSALLHKKEYAYLDDKIKKVLQNSNYVQIYNYIEKEYNNGRKPIISALFTMFDVDANKDVDELINYEFETALDSKKYFDTCLNCIANITNEKEKLKLLELLKTTLDTNEKIEIVNKLNKLIKLKQ